MSKNANITQDFDLGRDAALPKSEISELVVGTWSKLLRQRSILIACTVFFVFSSIFYVVNARPLFTAGASLIIDPRLGAAPEKPVGAALLLSDALLVDSEVRVLRSRNLTHRLMEELNLYDVEATRDGVSASEALTQWAKELFSISKHTDGAEAEDKPLSELQIREAKRRQFIRNLDVQRVGNTYVIEIRYTSPDSDFSAAVVNTLISEYFSAASEENFDNAERLSEWLTQRITILEDELSQAEETLAAYREENDLFAVKGSLLPAQAEISALTQQALELEADLFEIEGDLFTIRDMLSSGSINAGSVFDAKYALLRDIQREYLQVLEEKREIVSLRGAQAPQLVAVEKVIDDVSAQIFSEVSRIEESLRRQQTSMQSTARSIEVRLEELRIEASNDAQNAIKLRGLERDVAAKQNQLENMLKEFNSVAQSRTFERPPARIMGLAVAPDKKSSPKSKRVVLVSTMAGLFLGALLGLLREELDGSFRTPEDVLDDIGLNYLGAVPTMRSDRRGSAGSKKSRRRNNTDALRRIPRRIKSLFFAAREPRSIMADTLRALSIAIDERAAGRDNTALGHFSSVRNAADAPLLLSSPINGSARYGRVIGFTSARLGDGKTTLASNFAAMLAARGARAVLIDLDFATSSASKTFGPLPESNLVDTILDGRSTVQNLADRNSFCGLTVVGHDTDSTLSPSDLKCSARLKSLIADLKRDYDFVVVDMAPPNLMADAKAVSGLLNDLVLVVEWGKTPKSLVKSMMRLNPAIKESVLGVLFNKVNMNAFESYASEFKREYYGF